MFFKQGLDYHEVTDQDRVKIGVLTAAAERVRPEEMRAGPNAARFIAFLLDVAQMQNCTHLVLSAWGCGAFHQHAPTVARLFESAFQRLDKKSYPKVVFAILDDHNSPPPGNLNAFRAVFHE